MTSAECGKTPARAMQGEEEEAVEQEVETPQPPQKKASEAADASTREYLWSLVRLVESGAGDRDALAASALEAVAGKEVVVLCDPRAGPALEKLIPLFNAAQVAALLGAIAADAVAVCCGGCGSHLVEAVLARVSALLEDDAEGHHASAAEARTLADGVAALANALQQGATWADVAYDANGSHVIRALLAMLAPPHDPALLSKALRTTVRAVAAGVIAAVVEAEGGVAEAARDAHAGAALSAVLVALAPTPPLAAAAVAKIVDALTPDQARELATDAVGSHVIEGVLEAAPADGHAFSNVYTRWLRGCVAELAADRIGNHVVQRLLASPGCGAAEAALIVGELLPKSVAELLPRRDRAGVIMHAAEACQRLGVLQTELVGAIRTACNAASEKPQDAPRNPAAFAETLLLPQASYAASRTAQAILGMKREASKILANSLVELGTEKLTAVACDAAGSRVVEAALSSTTLPPQIRLRIVAALKGHLADIACTAPGSRVVERCYAAADVANKEAIAAELMASEQRLSEDFNGRFALRACKVQLYRQKREVWRNAVSHAAKKCEMFADIVDPGDGTPSTAAAAPVSKKASTALQQQQQQQQTEYDGFMEMLGFGPKAGTKKKRKTPKEKAETAAPLPAPTEEETEKKDGNDDLAQAVAAALGGESSTTDGGDGSKKKKKKRKKRTESATGDEAESAPKPQRRKFTMF